MHNCMHEFSQFKTFKSFLLLFLTIKRLRQMILIDGNHLTLHSIRRNIASDMLSGIVFPRHTDIPGSSERSRIPSSFSSEGDPESRRVAELSCVASDGAPVFSSPVSFHFSPSWAVMSSLSSAQVRSLFRSWAKGEQMREGGLITCKVFISVFLISQTWWALFFPVLDPNSQS